MPLQLDEVRRIAALAKLELEPATLETLRHQLESILDYVARLDELEDRDTGIPGGTPPDRLPLRADACRPPRASDRACGSAPDAAEGHFRVPRVIE